MYKTIALILLSGASFAFADPSVNGLEHRNSPFDPNRNDCGKTIHNVPDAGSTLGLLALGSVAIVAARRKLQP